MTYFTYFSDNIQGNSHDVIVHIISDNSGYYILSYLTGTTIAICRYLFLSSLYCQTISSINTYPFSQLMLSNTEIFFVGANTASPYPFYYIKVTYESLNADWTLKMN